MFVAKARAVTVAAAFAALSVSIAAPAGAKTRTVQVQTEVRFLEVNTQTFLDFSGQIGSKKICRDDRQVSLFYKANQAAAAQQVGSAETDRSGAFLVSLSSPAVVGLYSVEIAPDVEVVRHGDVRIRFRCRLVASAFVSF